MPFMSAKPGDCPMFIPLTMLYKSVSVNRGGDQGPEYGTTVYLL